MDVGGGEHTQSHGGQGLCGIDARAVPHIDLEAEKTPRQNQPEDLPPPVHEVLI